MEHLWTALFCTIHLCVGFVAGRSTRRESSPIVPSSLGPAVAEFQQALGAAQPALAELPEHFQTSMRQLQESVARLERELAKERQKTHPTPALSNPSVPRRQEADTNTPSKVPDNRRAERLGYTVPEYMALFDEDSQSIGDFEQVQCHDLSSTGVSFFLNRYLAAGETLFITLGQQNGGTVMAVRVIYSRPIIVRGEDRYRIGCQFIRRLSDEEVTELKPLLAAVKSVYAITAVAN